MNKRNNLLFVKNNLTLVTLFLLVVVIGASYRPIVDFGLIQGTNLKLSLAYGAIVLFGTLSIMTILKNYKILLTNFFALMFFSYCLFSTLSIFWSTNTPRAVLMSGLLFVLFWLFISVYTNASLIVKYKKSLTVALYVSASAIAFFSWWQVFGEAFGVSQVYTLLPDPYLSNVFGYARPTGLMLEPQFLGSYLLIPLFISAFNIIYKSNKILSPHLFVFILSLSTIIATLSRGAYIAVVVGFLLLIIITLRSGKNRQRLIRLMLFIIPVLAFSLGGVVLAAEINTRDETNGEQSFVKTVNHASLGVLNIELPDNEEADSSSAKTIPKLNSSENVKEKDVVATIPAGYVKESTDSRVLMRSEALKLWSQNPISVLFGVGIGGFGKKIHEQNSQEYSINSIVNNQYVEVLTETGLVGFILFICVLGGALYLSIHYKAWPLVILLGAFYAQWFFFSGNINIPHLWLILSVAATSPLLVEKHSKNRRVL